MSDCFPPGFPIINGIPGGGGGGGASSSNLLAEFGIPTVAATGVVLVNLVDYTVAADTLDTNGQHLRLWVWGDYLTTASKAFTFVVALAGVTMLGIITGASGASAQRRPWWSHLDFMRVTAGTARLGGVLQIQGSIAAPLAGVGSVAGSAAGGPVGSGAVDPVCDWTINEQLQFGVIPSVAGDDFTLRGGTLERLSV